MIVGNRVIKSFVKRVREKLSKIDFDRQVDVNQAANALSFSDRVNVSGDKDAVVKGLEAHVKVHFCTVTHTDDGIAEPFGYNDVERALAHLARAMYEVIHRKGEGGKGEVRHNRLS
ncbi:MAG: hypothetical protein JWQ43_3720 [Glaciihabitans sp.]|nr:hypothetical protein [Glaciihabitans sp.]